MKVEYKGKIITDLQNWKTIVYLGAKAKDWVLGRSAPTLADFIINKNGESFIKAEVSKVIGEELVLEVAHSEYEITFDSFNHGREHDLGIYGKTASGKSIFIGLEAKVDESFGDTISAKYLEGKVDELNGGNTNLPKRIEELLIRNFEKVKKSHFKLRYQLLYSTVGTTAVKTDIHILFILVFKSTGDKTKIKNNKKDYLNFFKKLNAKPLPQSDNFEVEIEGKRLMVVYKTV